MTFKSIAEFLDPQNGHHPTTAERKLITATQAGETCYLTDKANPTRPTANTDATSIRPPLLRLLILGGTKDCGLHERGVQLVGGWIEDPLDLAFCTGKGATVLDFCHFEFEPNLTQTTLQQLSLDNSTFPGLMAQGAQISGGLFLQFVIATGTVKVGGAEIGGQLDCEGAKFDGGIDKKGAQQRALNAQGVEVGQDIFLRSVTATGTVDLGGIKIGGQLVCEEAKFDGGKDKKGAQQRALNAQGAEVGEDLLLSTVIATGTVAVNGAKIGGVLTCEGAEFDGNGERALHAQRMRVTQGFFFRKVKKVKGLVDLNGAHVGDLVDDVKSWPTGKDSLILDGFTYDRIAGTSPTTFAARRDWLETGSHWEGDFRPQPFTQLARVLRQMGHAGEARKVLIEHERLLAAHRLESDRKDFRDAVDGGEMTKGDSGKIWLRMRSAQLWSWLTGKVAGYGYAPQNALYLSLACIGGFSFFAYSAMTMEFSGCLGRWCRPMR